MTARKHPTRLTHERLLNVLDYDPETGVFTWIMTLDPRWPAGSTAGSKGKDGYVRISIDGERFLAHRLAWFYVNNRWPSGNLDHRSVTPANNRIAELREATKSQNEANKPLSKANTSGFKGAFFYKKTGRWGAQIRIDGKLRHLGMFSTAAEAHEAYAAAAIAQHGEFARLK